jgi:hypothetical protein
MRPNQPLNSLRCAASALLACVCAGALGAAEAGDAGTWAPPDDAIMRAFATKDYPAADAACRDQLTRQPTNVEATYGLACALAREGRPDEAFTQLEAATADGFCDAKRAQADDDLDSLHGKAAFATVLARMREVPIGTGCPDEPGADIPGLTTIERQPKGGLRFRLRLSQDATRAKPARLVIWLHPSGGSMDEQVEGHALDLAAHRCCLCVFPRKQYIGWSDQEGDAIAPTVADLATIPGVDARKPILMGFSAGGQTAITLFGKAPSAWGGLLLDAAYPVNVDRATGQASLLEPGAAAGATHLPILVLVGGDDPNGGIWDKAMPAWNQAGLRPTVRVVPGKRHQYLFDGDEWTATLAFLDGIAGAKVR